jgi:TolA-binding protein
MQQSFINSETSSLFDESHLLMSMGDFATVEARNTGVLDSIGLEAPADMALYNLGLLYAHPDNPQRNIDKAAGYFRRLVRNFPASKFAEDAKIWAAVIMQVKDCREERLLALKAKNTCKENKMAVLKEKNIYKQNQLAAIREKNTIEVVDTVGNSGIETPTPGGFEAAITEKLEQLSADGDGPGPDVILYQLGLLSAHNENPKKDYKMAMVYMNRLVTEYPGSPLVDEARIWLGVFDVIEKIQQVDVEIDEKKKEFVK